MEQTFNFQVKGTAVKLVLVGDFAPVVSTIVLFGLNDVHLKCVYLSHGHISEKVKKNYIMWCSKVPVGVEGTCIFYNTLLARSNVSFSCKCFPVLLARSIHFPLNHLIVGLRRRSLASTLATNVMSPPLGTEQCSTTVGCQIYMNP